MSESVGNQSRQGGPTPLASAGAALAYTQTPEFRKRFEDAQAVLGQPKPDDPVELKKARYLLLLRITAKDCGYALAVHGSEQRDLDLVAVPWTPEAVSAQDLVDTLCERMPLHPQVANVYPSGHVMPNPEPKPWGRLGWSLVGCPPFWKYIDLSVAPRAGEAVPVVHWRDALTSDEQQTNPGGEE